MVAPMVVVVVGSVVVDIAVLVVGSPLSRLLPPCPPPLPCGVMGRMLLPILRTGAGPQNPA